MTDVVVVGGGVIGMSIAWELSRHGVSVKVLSKETIEGLYVVEVRATDRTGRIDEDIGAVMLAAMGQGDIERPRRGMGVVEEQLIEIAHAIEQKAIGMILLDGQILDHHRRDLVGLGRRGGLGAHPVHGGQYSVDIPGTRRSCYPVGALIETPREGR